MRPLLTSAVALLAFDISLAAASPVGPPSVGSFEWGNGDQKKFSLTWDGTRATFAVEGVGTSVYGSLGACCADTFDRVRELHPGASLTFTDLSINTMPVNTVFHDGLSLTLFKKGALDNLGLLTGIVTLRFDDPYSRMAYMAFDANPWMASMGPTPTGPTLFVSGSQSGELYASPEMYAPTVVPEPGTLALLGAGLIGVTRMARRQLAERARTTSRRRR